MKGASSGGGAPLLLLVLVLSSSHAHQAPDRNDPGRPVLGVDVAAYLSTADMVWSWNATMSPSTSAGSSDPPTIDPLAPTGWWQSAYLGNGLLGVMVTAVGVNATTPSLRLDIGRTDVWCARNRQPIGFLTLTPQGGRQLHRVDMRAVLANATLLINLTMSEPTVQGSDPSPSTSTITSTTQIEMLVAAGDPQGPTGILIARFVYPSTSESSARSASPHSSSTTSSNPTLNISWTPDTSGTCGNKSVEHGQRPWEWSASGIDYYVMYNPIGTYTAALARVPSSPAAPNFGGDKKPVRSWANGGEVLVLSVANTQRTATPLGSKEQAVQSLAASYPQLDTVVADHVAWWQNYWTNTSFFSFDSAGGQPGVTSLETFTHVASFRYAMAARFSMSDLMGPWGPAHATQCIGPWCQLVWDMNQQVMLYLPTPSNRGDVLGLPALDMFGYFMNNTWEAVFGSNPPGGQTNIIWWLANVHRYCLAYGDDERLLSSLLPGLRAMLSRSTLKNGTDGLLHVYGCESPEYPMGPSTDCTYDLAIYQWGAQTALAVAEALAPSDPMLPLYRDILRRLAPFPVDAATGAWELAVGVPFAKPHRHYSHLLQVYDLRTAGAASGDVEKMQVSLDQWWNITCAGPQAHGPDYQGDGECRGFTQAGMAFMNSRLNRTHAALGNLTAYLRLVGLPNGMYGEEIYQGDPDLFAPVSESAYSAAAAAYDLLLSSSPWPPRPQSGQVSSDASNPQPLRIWRGLGGRNFPFANATFYRLRSEGALLVSAVRENWVAQWVAVEAPLVVSIGSSANKTGSNIEEVAFLLHVADWEGETALQVVSAQSGITVASQGGPGLFLVLGLRRGSAVTLLPVSQPVPPGGFVVDAALGRNATEFNTWGSTFAFHGELP